MRHSDCYSLMANDTPMSATLESVDPLSVPSKLYDKASNAQRLSGATSIGCAITAVILTCIYCDTKGDGYLGGLNLKQYTFNWHPILMVTGLIFCSVSALLSYRLIPATKLITKSIHGILHTAGIICMCIGFSAVYISNNDPKKNELDIYFSNFTTIHSLLGLFAIMLYGQNFLCGIFHYISPFATLDLKKFYMPSHIFFGLFSLFAAGMAALTGIMELEKENNCFYDVSHADKNPAGNYHKLKESCQVLNGMGIMIFLTLFFAAFALWDLNAPVVRNENGELTTDRRDKLLG